MALGSSSLNPFRSRDRELRQLESAQRDSQVFQRLIQEFEGQSSGWFWETDDSGRITYISHKVAAVIAGETAEPKGLALSDLLEVAEGEGVERTLLFYLSSKTTFSDLPVRSVRHPDRVWSVSGRPILDKLGHVRGFIGFGSDLTEKRRAEAEITRLALSDDLTGLANRQRLKNVLQQTLSLAESTYRKNAIFLLDLDRFKEVNDTLGHPVGDQLLKQVAQRVSRCVGERGVVGRLGGDEFQIILSGEGDVSILRPLAVDIIGSISQPYFLAGAVVNVGCSIGIAIAPEHGTTVEEVLRNADLALYAAKAGGRGQCRFFDDVMLDEAKHRKRLEESLRVAVGTPQLSLAYQPVVKSETGDIVGFEALLRWTHPELGVISPAQFIPIAEESGLIEQLGIWVLQTALRDATQWPEHVRVAVNVSPAQFRGTSLTGSILKALDTSGVAPERLELEITESVFLQDEAASQRVFERLKAIGVRLALDDFGTGYSSMSYLNRAPFNKIKIDQSFVRGAALKGSRNPAIIKAIVDLAAALEMETTAEGVEYADEVELLRDIGCSHLQGYAYGRPMPIQETLALFGDGERRRSTRPNQRTRPKRVKLLRHAQAFIDGRKHHVLIRDLSPSGVLFELRDPYLIDAPDLMLQISPEMYVRAKPVWQQDKRVGAQFEAEIDLEGITRSKS